MKTNEKVYLVWDGATDSQDLICVNRTYAGARQSVIDFLIHDTGYCDWEWEDMAQKAGYDSVSEFQENIRLYPDYDDIMQIAIEEIELKE